MPSRGGLIACLGALIVVERIQVIRQSLSATGLEGARTRRGEQVAVNGAAFVALKAFHTAIVAPVYTINMQSPYE